MRRHFRRLCLCLLLGSGWCFGQGTPATVALTWQETVQEFKANNPTLLAGKVTIDQARADEITAFLRPNPDLSVIGDDLGIFSYSPFRPTANGIFAASVSYLVERRHKRELRLDSAQQATAIAIATQDDLERNLRFNLRDAFVRVLLAKAVRQVAENNLKFYDQQIRINRERLNAGAMARVDYQRVELQRVQYESDLGSAEVNLRTAKIDLLQLLRDRTPVDTFDVVEPFDYQEPATKLEEARSIAMATRPDLLEAQKTVDKAKVDHKLAVANGSTDPTWSADVGRQPPLTFYAGLSLNIPLRIFDRNQGEKLRTDLEIGRSQRLLDAAQVSTTHDVDAAYATLQNTLTLLRPYKEKYLKEATDVRETISYSYNHGAASLLDFLSAQQEYRATELSYVNLVGAYLSAANQVNFAVGREVIK